MKMKRLGACFTVLALSLPSAAWWSNDGEQPYAKISDDFVSPHLEICSDPPRRLKVFVTAWGVGQREVVELRERFAYDPVLFPQLNIERFHPFGGKGGSGYAASMDADGYRQVCAEKLAQLASCDAILFGKVDPSLNFPDGFMEAVTNRVASGAGLVWIAPFFQKVNLPGVTLHEVDVGCIFPCSLVPQLKGTRAYAGTLGAGRVLQIVYPPVSFPYNVMQGKPELKAVEPLTPFESDDPLYYDICLAFLGKCLWYVSPVPGVGSVEHALQAERIESVYNSNGEITDPSSRSVALKLIRWKSAHGHTIDYTIEAVAQNPGARMAIAFPKDGFKPNERIAGELFVPESGELTVTMTDEHGREILRRTESVEAGTRRFVYDVLHQQSRFAAVKAVLRSGGRVVDEAFAKIYFNTVAHDRDDFVFSIWSDHPYNSRVSKLALSQMRSEGIDNVMDCTMCGNTPANKRAIPRWIHEAGCNSSVYCVFLRGPGKKEKLSDDCGSMGRWEKWQRDHKLAYARPGHPWKAKTELVDWGEAVRDVGAFFYNLGDENGLVWHGDVAGENCFCKACQRRFREYLKRTFGTLDALNREYRSSYADWSDIVAMPFIEAAKKRKMALWADFRAFMEDQWVDYHRAYRDEIMTADPDAWCGVEGMAYPHVSFSGWNYYKFFPHFRFAAPYFSQAWMHAHQYLPVESTTGAWYGSYEGSCSPLVTRRTPWRYFFAGLDGAFWWTAGFSSSSASFSSCTVFRPDLTFLENFSASAAEVRYIKESGLGMLLHRAPVWNCDVEVHYSNPCMHASTINPMSTTWELSHGDFSAALAEAGIGYRFRDPQSLEAGIPETVKAFLLPCSQALSQRECDELRKFVVRGGVLVADVLPGLMTEHCAFREASPLADVFDETPLVVKRTGRGYAVLLGDYIHGIDMRIAENSAGGLAEGLRRYLALGGVKSFVRVTDENGSLRSAEVRAKCGVTYVCMLGGAAKRMSMEKASGAESTTKAADAVGGSATRVLTFDRPVCCYDFGRSKNGALLGIGRNFTVELEPIVGRVLAFTDDRIASPTLSLRGEASIARGKALDFTLGGSRGCLTVEAVDPLGNVAFTTRLAGSDGRFVPSYNAVAGTWKLRVRSPFGGEFVEKPFVVR